MIVYQMMGDGPIDVLVEPQSWLPIDLMWEEPKMVRFLERLSSFCRHLWFDPRGRGASDPVPHDEGRLAEGVMDDMVALLDAIGWNEVGVLGLAATHEVLFAATHPERVTALVLVEPAVRYRRSSDYPEGWDDETLRTHLAHIERYWGTGANLRLVAPSVAADHRFARWFARCERMAMSPAEARWRIQAAFDVDLRHILPAITVPTLVVQPSNPTPGLSQYVVDHIVNCRHVEGPDPGHLFFTGNTAVVLDSIEEFLTGRLPTRDLGRVLATVLFTDVVGSTEHLARLGDRRWLDVLADHNAIVRTELARFRGREVKFTGDGVLATFDGPGRRHSCRPSHRPSCATTRHRHPCRTPHRRDRARRQRHRRCRRPHRPTHLRHRRGRGRARL